MRRNYPVPLHPTLRRDIADFYETWRLPTVWSTSEGAQVPIAGMAHTHLLRSIWMLLAKTEDIVRVHKVPYVTTYDVDAWSARKAYWYPTLAALIQEAENRNFDWDLSEHWQPPVSAFWHRANDGFLELPTSKPGVVRRGKPLCFAVPVAGDTGVQVTVACAAECAERPYEAGGAHQRRDIGSVEDTGKKFVFDAHGAMRSYSCD